ncbi:MAG: DUF3291 domain-containing protein [Pseudomonadota bacterium]
MSDQPAFHLAQVNIARARFPIDDPGMADIIDQMEEINASAEQAPGFVWRLKDESGRVSSFQPFDDSRMLINLWVWKSVEALHDFVYKTADSKVMRRRDDWFERPHTPDMCLWWTPADEHPTTLDGTTRLLHLSQFGPTASAFTFEERFPVPAARV